MQVKLLCSRSGIGFSQNFGDEIEVDDEEGLRMIEAGQAKPFDDQAVAKVRVEAERVEAERVEAERVEAERVEAERVSEKTETATAKVTTEKAVKK